jgi:hypothetical protein
MSEDLSSLSMYIMQIDYDYGETEKTQLLVLCNGTCFCIVVTPEHLHRADGTEDSDASTLKKKYLQMFERAQQENHDCNQDFNVLDPDTDSEAVKLADWILEPCKPLFTQLTSLPLPANRLWTLEEYYQTESFCLKLVNEAGHLKALQCLDFPTITNDTYFTKMSASDLDGVVAPRTKASCLDIIPGLGNGDAWAITPTKVRIQGGDNHFFKTGLSKDSLRREIDTLLRIHSAGLPEDLHVTKIHSLVEIRDGSIVGMLLNYIDVEHELHIATAEDNSTSLEDRKKWMEQIRYVVSQLHSVGIVWGDVHPGNVVIDKGGNAWVVDFGGGYWPEWVNQKYAGTITGDLQGLSNIAKAMGV